MFPAGRPGLLHGCRGQTEKILEEAEDIKDGHKKAKKAKAKTTAATAESEDGLHGSAARLELTRKNGQTRLPCIKRRKQGDKLDSARAALPKKRVPVREKVYDAVSGKANPPCALAGQATSLKPSPASRPFQEALLLFAHGKSMKSNTKM